MIILLLILYKLSLDLTYSFIFIPLYGYVGYKSEFQIYDSLISWGIYLSYIWIYIKLLKNKSVSSNIILLIITFYFVPVLTLYSFNSVDKFFLLNANIYLYILSSLQITTPIFYIENNINKYKRNIKIYNTLIIFCFILSIYLNIKYTSFRIVFDFFNVYDIRYEATKYSMNLFEKYTFNLLPIILSVLATYSLKLKKMWSLNIIILSEWLLFSIAGQKMIFFLTILNILSYICYNKYILRNFLIMFLIIPLIGYLEYLINKTSWIIAIIYDRVIFGVPYLSFYYYEFFKENPINFFRDGILSKFGLDSIYFIEIGKVIAENMQKIQFNNANNGLLGNAISGIGIMGVFILPIVIIVSLRLLDSTTYNKPLRISYGTCIYFYTYYTNGSFSEVLIGGGMLLIIILYYFFPIEEVKV